MKKLSIFVLCVCLAVMVAACSQRGEDNEPISSSTAPAQDVGNSDTFAETDNPAVPVLPEYVLKSLNDMKRQIETNDAKGFAASVSAALSDAMQYAPFDHEYYEFINDIDVTVHLDSEKIYVDEYHATATIDLDVRDGNGVIDEGMQTANLVINEMGITQFMVSTNGNFVYYIHRNPAVKLSEIETDMCDTAGSIIDAFSPRAISLNADELSDDEKRMLILSVFYKSGKEFTATELEKYAEERFSIEGLDPTNMVEPGFQFSFNEDTALYYLGGTEPRCRAVYSMYFLPAEDDKEPVLRVYSYKEALRLVPDKTVDFHFKIITNENIEYARLVSVQALDK